MNTAKQDVDKLPDNCAPEDVQYNLSVANKVRTGIERAEREGTRTQTEVERIFAQWMTQ